jgi:large-conductance mechanosensitive channel
MIMYLQVAVSQEAVSGVAWGGFLNLLLLLLFLAIICFFIIRGIKKRKNTKPRNTCPYCNNAIDPVANFCENCGSKIR